MAKKYMFFVLSNAIRVIDPAKNVINAPNIIAISKLSSKSIINAAEAVMPRMPSVPSSGDLNFFENCMLNP